MRNGPVPASTFGSGLCSPRSSNCRAEIAGRGIRLSNRYSPSNQVKLLLQFLALTTATRETWVVQPVPIDQTSWVTQTREHVRTRAEAHQFRYERQTAGLVPALSRCPILILLGMPGEISFGVPAFPLLIFRSCVISACGKGLNRPVRPRLSIY